MVAKQLSIFLENKSGRLTEVTEVLAKEGVNLSALCIAENADFGILRGIVSEPDKAYKALKDNHFAVNVTDVVGISCPNIPGSLAKVLRFLSDEGVFIEYMYSFANGETANVIMSLEEAVDLVLFAFENGTSGDILVQKAPACTIRVLAQAVTELFHPGHEIKVIGIRHGEKMYETLLTNEECAHAVDMGDFYRVPADNRDLNYDNYFNNGEKDRNLLHEFNSNNTRMLNVEETKEKIAALAYIREEMEKDGIV